MGATRVFIEFRDNVDDAIDFLDSIIDNKTPEEVILEADVKYINGHWRIGVILGDEQLEMDL